MSNNMDTTLLEILNYLMHQHPHLVCQIEALAAKKQGRNISDTNLLMAINNDLLYKSRAQLRQDIFVLHELNFKRNGYFVEFGATNGVYLSNTYLLEKEFGWKGILAEPAICWHDELKNNRNAHVETKCVWGNSGSIVSFNQASEAEFSTVDCLPSSGDNSESKDIHLTYNIETISLNDLLAKYDAPRNIDYLSVDTEGSEFEILSNLDFSKYTFKVITCEHNYSAARDKIYDLLTANGYIRKYDHLSQFDDWYVHFAEV